MQILKKFIQITAIFLLFHNSGFAQQALSNADLNKKALAIVNYMSLPEKIGQKLMLDFRYWCDQKPGDNQPCTQDFTSMNENVASVMRQNHIGGVILFSNNLKDIAQITTLTDAFQQNMRVSHNLPLLIGTDQEGGIVARLPRDVSVTFPGNMALAAAWLGDSDIDLSASVGALIAKDLNAVGINTDFAPDVDVNVNPENPVINVRAFSDDPELVMNLGLRLSKAIQLNHVAATLKHFPGHGDTNTDSLLGLPVVDHTLEEAWKIDLYPFKKIIQKNAPDLIMTAHIQYPALDDTKIYASKAAANIIAPATLSKKIQSEILRQQLNYQGVVVTDALDMGAIAQNFEPIDATIKAFEAGDDIALMPVMVSGPNDMRNVTQLIEQITAAVKSGAIKEKDLDKSVLRIITLKLKLGLLSADEKPLPERITYAQALFANPMQRDLEALATNSAMTLVQNNNQLIPIKLQNNANIYILTPWLEQGAGIAKEISRLQAENKLPANLRVNFVRMSDTNLEAEKAAISYADIVIVGSSTTKASPVVSFEKANFKLPLLQPRGSLVFPEIPSGDNRVTNLKYGLSTLQTVTASDLTDVEFAYQALAYAKNLNKKTILLSLLAPYDLPNYKDVSDAMLAGYDFYGYLDDSNGGYFRGPSMQALTRIIFGISPAKAKLPVNVPDPSKPDVVVYPRGFGLSTH